MARRAFFSFHYERDCRRAGQVRNSWVTKDRESAGFWDAAAWEEVKKKTDAEIEKWIGEQLVGTSVTVVLIGAETSTRQYVGYEINLSHDRGNGILAIYIHSMKDVNRNTDTKGANPLANWYVERNGKRIHLSDLYPTYDWVNDNGYEHLGDWIEAAAKKAGK
jgi:hypothetical protein